VELAVGANFRGGIGSVGSVELIFGSVNRFCSLSQLINRLHSDKLYF
jgi:hypothetical protein